MQSKPGWLLSVLTLTAHGSSLDIFILQRDDPRGQTFSNYCFGKPVPRPVPRHSSQSTPSVLSPRHLQVLFFLSPSAKPQNYTHMILGFSTQLKDELCIWSAKPFSSQSVAFFESATRKSHPLFLPSFSLPLSVSHSLSLCMYLSVSECMQWSLFSLFFSICLPLSLSLSASLCLSLSLCGSLSMSLPPPHGYISSSGKSL